jgi:hypothetical protein
MNGTVMTIQAVVARLFLNRSNKPINNPLGLDWGRGLVANASQQTVNEEVTRDGWEKSDYAYHRIARVRRPALTARPQRMTCTMDGGRAVT